MFLFCISLEGMQLTGPESLHVIDPVLQRDKTLRTEPVYAQPRIAVSLSGLNHFYQAALSQHSKVPAQRRAANGTLCGKVAGA
jgi:hypothetical protein